MCGLVGMAGDIDKEDRNMFRQMLIVDAIRGHHSTGVASATPRKGDLLVFKKALNPVDFMQLRGFDQVVDWSSQVLMGHNRYATVGKINNGTAHPFEHDGVIGAHNGTLERWFSLPDAKEFDVDSECLIWNIANHGFPETMKKTEGAYALTVYDDNAHELHILRNKERPMYFGYKHDKSVLYWASEAWMIRNMAARCGIKLQKNITQPKEHQLLTWKLPNVKNAKMPDPFVMKLEAPKEKKYSAPVTFNGRPYGAQASQGSKGQTGASSYGSYTARGRNTTKIVNVPGVQVGDHIAFVPVSIQTSKASNAKYIEGIMTSYPWAEIRVYHGDPNTLGLIDGDKVCSGRVAALAPGYDKDDEAYLVIDTQSAKLTDEPYDTINNPAKAKVVVLPIVTHNGVCREKDGSTVFSPGPAGKMIEMDRWDELTKHGCGYCTAPIDDNAEIEWVGDAPVCPDCNTVNH